ncbi:MAG TPA: Lrp/AsnC family transcriptional regulator [Geothrix sp.]|jgi:Lrp/AsnC family leucine-responsive transcriptional regulator|nr:Lrp/AsnC family transcriptional regulator [Geothrix sp.]
MAKTLIEDDLNRRLVALLQQEGRMSHAELAERLGVSRPTIIDRVKRLEADGVLSGYAARVSPASVNKPTVAFVAVRYKDNNEAIEQRFIKALEDEPDILEAHTIAGEDALLLKVVAETPAGIAERLRRIRALGPMVTTRTTIVLETHWEKSGPSPFPLEHLVKKAKK